MANNRNGSMSVHVCFQPRQYVSLVWQGTIPLLSAGSGELFLHALITDILPGAGQYLAEGEAKIVLLQIFYEPQSILLTHYPVKVSYSHMTLEWGGRDGGRKGGMGGGMGGEMGGREGGREGGMGGGREGRGREGGMGEEGMGEEGMGEGGRENENERERGESEMGVTKNYQVLTTCH